MNFDNIQASDLHFVCCKKNETIEKPAEYTTFLGRATRDNYFNDIEEGLLDPIVTIRKFCFRIEFNWLISNKFIAKSQVGKFGAPKTSSEPNH
jgi:hypothetical protein